jgi:SWIM zinc finger
VLAEKFAVTPKYVTRACCIPVEAAQAALEKLCRLGRAMFDVRSREFRHRELFEKPIDEARLYPPDARIEKAGVLLSSNSLSIASCAPEETRKIKMLKTLEGRIEREVVHRDWRVIGAAGDQKEVELVVNDNGRLIFGRCGCAFFREHLLAKGPCEHLLALFRFSDATRQDLPSSTASNTQPAEDGIDDDDDDA